MTLLLVHAAATLFMTGLIGFVQVVHYPMLRLVDNAGALEHQRRTTWVVLPVMAVELVTALLLLREPDMLRVTGAVLLGVIWVSTFAVQVPLHQRLAQGDAGAGRKLVASNWVRTVAWSARGVIALAMLTPSA